MMLFFFGATAVLLVGLLSRDHDISASQEAVVSADLNLSDAALAHFPDEIHLVATPVDELAYLDRVRAAFDGLMAEGFGAAGAFRIDEMPGVSVVLMTNPRARMSATVYDHERAGVWVEVVSRYEDGRRWTHTTLEGAGLSTRPGNTLVSLPGVSLAELLARARGDRPAEGLRTPDRRQASEAFEDDYAAWIEARMAQVATAVVADDEDDEPTQIAA